jgi:peptide/nickel transport system permease protein
MTGREYFGVLVFTGLLAAAALAPWVATTGPSTIHLEETLRAPSVEHPLGQDRLGRDLWSRLAFGARISLAIALGTVVISLLIGTVVGLLAGYIGGRFDEVVMRFVDVLLAFPGILLAIALAAVLGPSLMNVILALSAIGWTGYARLVRGETLALARRPHVEAARAIGVSSSRIVTRHILPLLIAPLTVQATFGFAGAIVAESSLSFLGIGVRPPTSSWGAMLEDGRSFLLVAPHVALVPGAAIFIPVLGINLLGDALRDRLDVQH